MTIETIRSALLWCTLIDYGILVLWFVLFLLPHEWMYRLLARFSKVSNEQFDTLNLAAMTLFKTAIWMFNIAPLIALWIVGR